MKDILLIILIFLICTLITIEFYTKYYNYFDCIYNAKKGNVQYLNLGPYYLQNTNIPIYCYNPSIFLDKNKNIIGVTRCSSVTVSECKKIENLQQKHNINNAVTLKFKQLNKKIHDSFSCILYFKLTDTFQNLHIDIIDRFNNSNLCDISNAGLEDPRIFYYNNEYYIYAHYRGNLKGNCGHYPVIFSINNPNNIIRLYTDNMNVIEKNWMPFVYKNELYFIYSVFPHKILKYTNTGYCQGVYTTNSSNFFYKNNKIGNGAPAQLINYNNKDYYITIAHINITNSNALIRKNFIYIFEAKPPFNIVGMTKKFDIITESYIPIEFCSGFVIKNNSIFLSFGVNDCFSAIQEYSLYDILENCITWF